jgi:hypothetical protein
LKRGKIEIQKRGRKMSPFGIFRKPDASVSRSEVGANLEGTWEGALDWEKFSADYESAYKTHYPNGSSRGWVESPEINSVKLVITRSPKSDDYTVSISAHASYVAYLHIEGDPVELPEGHTDGWVNDVKTSLSGTIKKDGSLRAKGTSKFKMLPARWKYPSSQKTEWQGRVTVKNGEMEGKMLVIGKQKSTSYFTAHRIAVTKKR